MTANLHAAGAGAGTWSLGIFRQQNVLPKCHPNLRVFRQWNTVLDGTLGLQ